MHSWEIEKIYTSKVINIGNIQLDRHKVFTPICEKKFTKAELANIIASQDDNLEPGSSSKDIRIQPKQDFKREGFEEVLIKAGLEIVRVVSPGEKGSTSSQFDTFIVKDKEEDKGGFEYQVVLGKGKGSTLRVEAYAFKDIKQQIEKILESLETAEDHFNVKVGDEVYKINGISTTEGSPKSDFSLDYNNDPVIFISHKGGLRAKDFNQYGGMTNRSGTKISTHPEVEKFVNEVKLKFPNGLKSLNYHFKEIQNTPEGDDLKLRSMYGGDYGGEFGRNNVNVILQGKIILSKLPGNTNTYELNAHKIMINGDLPDRDSEYDPILFVRFSGSRSGNYGVKNGRFMIVPISYIGKKLEEYKKLRQSINALKKSEEGFEDLLKQISF